MNSEIFNQVKRIIVDVLKIEEGRVTEKASFKDDLGMDSLDQAQLIMELGEAFHCDISEQDAEKILTVEDAVNYLKAKNLD